MLHQVGCLYIHENESNKDYLNKYYSHTNLNLSEAKYEHQFQPFHYSEDFDVYKNYGEGMTPGAWLLIIHKSIYDEIKDNLGIPKDKIYKECYSDEEIEPYESEDDADICGYDYTCYTLTFKDNDFKSQDDYIQNPKSLPKTVLDYLDLECKTVCYNWDGNEYDSKLYNQFKGSAYELIKSYNFNQEKHYIRSLEDFWNHIDNIGNIDVSIDIDKECEIIRNQLKCIYDSHHHDSELFEVIFESVKNSHSKFKHILYKSSSITNAKKDYQTLIKCSDIDEFNELKSKLSCIQNLGIVNELNNKIDKFNHITSCKLDEIMDEVIETYNVMNNFDLNINELLRLDNITLLSVLVDKFGISINKYYFDLEKRLKQIEIANSSNSRYRYYDYYKNHQQIKSELYPEYEFISYCRDFDTYEQNSKFLNNYNNDKLKEKEYMVCGSDDSFDNWGAFVLKYGNNYLFNDYVNDYIFEDCYLNTTESNEIRDKVEKYYWYSLEYNYYILGDYLRIKDIGITPDYIYCPNYCFVCDKPKIFLYTIPENPPDLKNITEHTILYDIHFKYSPLSQRFIQLSKECEKLDKYMYYNPNGEYIKNKEYNLNKYLPDIIVKSSDLFTEYRNEYSSEEIYELNLKLKEVEKLPGTSEEMALLIHQLIAYVQCDLVDDFMKSMVYNLFSLQMFDIIDLIEVITRRHLFNILKT